MRVSFPKTIGAIAGWMMLAFVIGVGWHTKDWSWRLPFVTWSIVIVFSVLIAQFVRPWRWKIVAWIIVSLFVGMCRADMSPVPKMRIIDGRLTPVRMTSESQDESFLVQWRKRITARVHEVLPDREAALVVGILYGGEKLSAEQKKIFRTAGLTHIVAVSGSNVTVVVQCLSMVVLGVGFRRRQAFWLTSVALLAFVGFVGFSASVVRAAFMGWLVLLAREVGRMVSPFRLLLVAAVFLLLIDPWQLLYDAGFALSFLAMWGILAWVPIFERWFVRLPNRFEMRTTLSMTLAATLMTAPYLAWMFGQFSLAGVLINVLALPLVPFIMGWGALVAVWGSWTGSVYLSAPVYGMARLLEAIAALTRFVPWLSSSTVHISAPAVATMYVVIVGIWRWLSAETLLSTSANALGENTKNFEMNVRVG